MRKILILVLAGIAMLNFNGVGSAADYEYIYTPPASRDNLGDLYDLEHEKAYAWAIDATEIINSGKTITGASLFFDDIRNWDNYSNALFISVLNTTSNNVGVAVYSDNDSSESNYFTPSDSYGSKFLFSLGDLTTRARDISVDLVNIDTNLIDSSKDLVKGDATYKSYLNNSMSWATETVNEKDGTWINMSTEVFTKLMSYASDGIFGLGFDPDCHFYNKGITLTLYATDAPTSGVPEPATLVLFGAGLLGLASRMRGKSRKI